MLCMILALAVSGCANLEGADSPLAANAPRVFEVANYGAKGDGVTDDGPAITSAVNAAIRAGGGTVKFPCGQYALLSVAGSVPGGRSILYFKDATNVTLQGQGSCSHLFTKLTQKSVIEFENSTYISVHSLLISAPNVPYVERYGMDGGSAVRYTGVTYGSISEIEVDGATAGAIYMTKGSNNISVTSNNVHDTYGSAVWEDDCGAANAINCNPSTPSFSNDYESNAFTNTSLDMGASIQFDNGSHASNSTARHNTISWNRQPVPNPANPGVHCIQVNNASGVNVLNNTCAGTPWDAIVVTTGAGGQCRNVTITGNIMLRSGTGTGGGSGIVVYDAVGGRGISNLTIESNSVHTASDDGIRLFAASQQGNVQQATIENNIIKMTDQRHPGSRFGIDVEYSNAINITANNITCNGKCIAAGVNINSSTLSSPSATANTVTDILGKPLVVQ